MARISKQYNDKDLQELLKNISKNVKAFREAKAWSRNKLSKATGKDDRIAVSTISEIEAGKIRDLRLSTVTALGRALGRNSLELLVSSDLQMTASDQKSLEHAIELLAALSRKQK